MRFRCERDTLLESLTTTSRAASTRGGLPQSFSGIRVETKGDSVHMACSDMEVTIQTTLAVQGSSDGIGVVPGRLSVDIVRAFGEGTVAVEINDDEATFSCGRSQFNVKLLPVEDFPNLPHHSGEGVTVPARELGEALLQVVRAASNDESKPLLTGVLMAAEKNGLRVVATDSYRLAIRDLPGANVLKEGTTVLVPARALGELQRVLSSATDGQSVNMVLGTSEVAFEIGSVVLTARLLSGKFPNYEQLIPPSYPNQLVVSKAVLLDAVKRMKLLIKDNTTPVRMSQREDEVVLSVIMPEIGQAREDIDAKYSGSESAVAFNPNYLSEGVEAVSSDEVILETIDSTKPATIRPITGDDFRYLLMPVRVS